MGHGEGNCPKKLKVFELGVVKIGSCIQKDNQVLPVVTLLGILSDLFRGDNVTSIWVIKRSRMKEAGM